MLLKLISCEVFTREIEYCLERIPHQVEIEYTEKAAHNESAGLRTKIQEIIDTAEVSGKKYDAILLCFGLCGNSTLGLTARGTKIVIPRAHDCCTLFLGSKYRFREYFEENPSRPFSSAGYISFGDSNEYLRDSSVAKMFGLDQSYAELVEKYGEENAEYLLETLNPAFKANHENKVYYIEVPEVEPDGLMDKCKEQAEAEGREFVKLKGSIRLIEKLLSGNWNDEDFLVLEPQRKTAGVYDWEEIIKASPDK